MTPGGLDLRRRPIGAAQPWLVRACRGFGSRLTRVFFTVEVHGADLVPPEGAVLLAGNHSGFLDGPLVFLLSPRPAVFLTKAELFVGPLARALGWLGQIAVHRGRPDRTALKQGLAVLAGGGALGVFPEGTRSTGQLAQTTDGLAYLALHSGAAVIPIAVLGTSAALPKGSWRPAWRAPVTIVFGAPISLAVEGDPRARRTVGVAAEQLRLSLVAHLRAAEQERTP